MKRKITLMEKKYCTNNFDRWFKSTPDERKEVVAGGPQIDDYSKKKMYVYFNYLKKRPRKKNNVCSLSEFDKGEILTFMTGGMNMVKEWCAKYSERGTGQEIVDFLKSHGQKVKLTDVYRWKKGQIIKNKKVTAVASNILEKWFNCDVRERKILIKKQAEVHNIHEASLRQEIYYLNTKAKRLLKRKNMSAKKDNTLKRKATHELPNPKKHIKLRENTHVGWRTKTSSHEVEDNVVFRNITRENPNIVDGKLEEAMIEQRAYTFILSNIGQNTH